MATSEAIDDGEMLAGALSRFYRTTIPLSIVAESKDLFKSLSTQRNSIDRSICADLNVIRHEFERGLVSEITWIPGKANLAHPGTKPDSQLITTLQLTLQRVRLGLSFPTIECCASGRSLGWHIYATREGI